MEVLIAVVVLGLAYVALLENFSVSLRQIDRLKRAGQSVLAETMDLDQKLRMGEEEEALPSNKESEAAIFLEGKTHSLVVVTSEQGTFQSLKLEKKK